MRKFMSYCLPLAALILAGCMVTIPPELEVRDVTSGRTYTTYESWGQVTQGMGYQFTDIETGKQITLTNYEVKTLASKKDVAPDSAEARSFNEAKARGGIK